MSGRRMGLCGGGRAGTGRSFFGRYGFGLRGGYGSGGGFRRGFCRGFAWYPPAYGSVYPFDQTNELDSLKAEAAFMKNALEAINERIAVMEKSSE
jgi:hypothetical protein